MKVGKLRAILRVLRDKAPTDHPVRVRRRPLPKSTSNGKKVIECGYATFCDDHYNIVVNSNLTAAEQEETLIHEYAHAVAFPKQRGSGEHDRTWGIAYAAVWRAYLSKIEVEDGDVET